MTLRMGEFLKFGIFEVGECLVTSWGIQKFLGYNDYVLSSCLLRIFASDLPKLFLHTVLT